MATKKRTDSIVAVTVAKRVTMYIEADTPEEAYKYAKEHCCEVDDWDFEDSDIEVDSYENYATEAEYWMDKIWIEDGKTLSFDEYVDQLEAQEEN